MQDRFYTCQFTGTVFKECGDKLVNTDGFCTTFDTYSFKLLPSEPSEVVRALRKVALKNLPPAPMSAHLVYRLRGDLPCFLPIFF